MSLASVIRSITAQMLIFIDKLEFSFTFAIYEQKIYNSVYSIFSDLKMALKPKRKLFKKRNNFHPPNQSLQKRISDGAIAILLQ